MDGHHKEQTNPCVQMTPPLSSAPAAIWSLLEA